MTTKKLVLIGVVISMVIAGIFSYFASSNPDGLEKVSGDKGLDVNATDSAVSDSIFADYGIAGLENSTGLAGVIGVIITAIIAFGLVKWLTGSNENKKN